MINSDRVRYLSKNEVVDLISDEIKSRLVNVKFDDKTKKEFNLIIDELFDTRISHVKGLTVEMTKALRSVFGIHSFHKYIESQYIVYLREDLNLIENAFDCLANRVVEQEAYVTKQELLNSSSDDICLYIKCDDPKINRAIKRALKWRGYSTVESVLECGISILKYCGGLKGKNLKIVVDTVHNLGFKFSDDDIYKDYIDNIDLNGSPLLDGIEESIEKSQDNLDKSIRSVRKYKEQIESLNARINKKEEEQKTINEQLKLLNIKKNIIVNLYPIYGKEMDEALINGEFKIFNNGEFSWVMPEKGGYSLKVKGLATRGGVVLRQSCSYPVDSNLGMIQKDSVYIVNVEGTNFIAENEVAYRIDSVDNTESKLLERRNSAIAIDDIYSISLTIANDIAFGDGLNELVYGEPRVQRIEVLKSSDEFVRVLK